VLLPCPLHILLPRYPRFLGQGSTLVTCLIFGVQLSVPAVDAAQLIWPLASNAQNSMQAVSAQGSRHCVLNAPLELLVQTLDGILVRSDFHCSGG
jgi:hypothetical protein